MLAISLSYIIIKQCKCLYKDLYIAHALLWCLLNNIDVLYMVPYLSGRHKFNIIIICNLYYFHSHFIYIANANSMTSCVIMYACVGRNIIGTIRRL